jgi:glycosyltransferase involved in cell wall biosynthesis
MNRLFEAFFYGKAIIATLLPKKYYPGLSSKNILFVNGSDEAAEKIEQMNDSEIRKRIENGAIEYYNNYFSPEKHKGDMNEIFTYLGVNYDK